MPKKKLKFSIEDLFSNERLEKFKEYKDSITQFIKYLSRTFPPDLIEHLEYELTNSINIFNLHSYKLKCVIDTNIIIQEAKRITKGKESSTPRIFSSPYIELYSCKDLLKEVKDKVYIEFTDKEQRQKAFIHTNLLLSKIKILTPDDQFYSKSKEIIGDRDPKDINFLAIALEIDAEAIVSNDKDFDNIIQLKRWDLKNLTHVIITRESGTISIAILGYSSDIFLKITNKFLVSLSWVLIKIIKNVEVYFRLVIITLSKIISKIPSIIYWVLLVIITIFIILYFKNENFKKWVSNSKNLLIKQIINFINLITSNIGNLWNNVLKETFIFMWNAGGEVSIITLAAFGAIGDQINELHKLSNSI